MDQQALPTIVQFGSLFRAAGGTERRVPAQAAIFAAGEPSDSVYLLTTGRAKLYLASFQGKRVLITLAFPGELLGESALVDDGTRRQTALALDNTIMLGLPRPAFVQLLQEHAPFAAAVAHQLAGRLFRVEQHIYRGTVQPVASRLASWLLEEHRHQGSGGRVHLDLQRRDLAELLGMARETLSLLLSRFADIGMVQYSRDQVRILQPSLLADCAEQRLRITAR